MQEIQGELNYVLYVKYDGFSINSKFHDPTSCLGADTKSQTDGRTDVVSK